MRIGAKGLDERCFWKLKDAWRRSACIKINLQVLETNSAVVRFYEEAGYEIEPRVSMGKRLPSKV